MFNIGSFFEKFNNAALREIKRRDVVARAIEKNIGAAIDVKDISFNDKIIQIKGAPGLKNQIFMKKEAILSMVRAELPGAIVTDLR
ncbi:MAG: hypothetical protein WCQ60_02390 [bacterium]